MKLHYRKIGEGQPLIILHGLFGSSDNWQTLGKKLAEDYEVYLVDQRNHGHSPHCDDFSYELMAEDLYELIDDNFLRDVILVGHSMGGKTAMTFALEHAEYLDKLVVVDMGIKEYPMHHETILESMLTTDLNVMKSRGEVDRHISQFIPSVVLKQFLMKNLYWKEKGQLAWRINLPVLNKEIYSIIGALEPGDVDLPTLFIRGEQSDYVLESDYPSIRSQFPQAEFQTIYGAGHWVHAESPHEFYNILMEFANR
jgi:esterase